MEPRGIEPEAIEYSNEYVRRLLLERHHVYAKLHNPGGSVILTASALVDVDRGVEYSSEIGNSWHLDLIELGQQLSELPKGTVDVLLTYIDDMSAEQAAPILHARGGVTVRKLRQRALDRLAGKMNERTV